MKTMLTENPPQENNCRDVVMGFVLVLFTYLFIGFVFFLTFPLPKACISDVSAFIDLLPRESRSTNGKVIIVVVVGF